MSFHFLAPARFSIYLIMDHLLREMDMQIRLCRKPPLFNGVWFRLNNAILKSQTVRKPRKLCAFAACLMNHKTHDFFTAFSQQVCL
jgi:hypothetical protein